jgi:hypothetical protein
MTLLILELHVPTLPTTAANVEVTATERSAGIGNEARSRQATDV